MARFRLELLFSLAFLSVVGLWVVSSRQPTHLESKLPELMSQMEKVRIALSRIEKTSDEPGVEGTMQASSSRPDGAVAVEIGAEPKEASSRELPECPACVEGQGQCFLGKCFCFGGFEGTLCDDRTANHPECSDSSDACLRHPKNGAAIIPLERWKKAQTAELQIWAGLAIPKPASGDRVDEHTKGFKQFRDLPAELGEIIEIGCGPWTQIRNIIDCESCAKEPPRPDFRIASATLVDPNAMGYAKLKHCPYRNGVLEFHTRDNLEDIVVINAGGEALTHLRRYDTAILINVVEHAQNAYTLMTHVYQCLKPGGLLIFHEVFHDDLPTSYWHKEDSVLHPLRVYRTPFHHLLSFFDPILLDDTPEHLNKRPSNPQQGIYFIGRKKALE